MTHIIYVINALYHTLKIFNDIIKSSPESGHEVCMKVKVKSLSHVQLFATPWTVAYEVPPSKEFSRQEYWNGLPFHFSGDLPNPGMEPGSPALQTGAFTDFKVLLTGAFKKTIPFVIESKRVKCPGINLPQQAKDQYSEAYNTLMKETEDDTNRKAYCIHELEELYC